MSDTVDANDLDIFDCLKTIGLDGSLQSMDPDGLCLMEIDDFSVVAGQPWASLWPVESRLLVTQSVSEASRGKVSRFSADCPTAKGTPKSWEVTVAPIRDADGAIVALQSLSQDVTRREHQRRETAIVSRELAHRIKNLFAVVDSLIFLSARTAPASKPFADGLRARISGLARAIAYIHPMSSSDLLDTPRTLQGLILTLVEPYQLAGADITVEGDDAEVAEQAVTSVALILNELATNAVKYGALKDAAGRLAIRLSRDAGTIRLRWEERTTDGAPGDMTPGFGTTLLNRTARSQLGASIERIWSADGLTVQLDVPLSRLAGT